ncbi:single-stranded DNA-binding protein [Chitinophaga sancti]|uniref:single-stranded DNA-binding protein n=1 Tax=Chitinophaga sancti TaxID=1004 RepID=UPI003F79DDD2
MIKLSVIGHLGHDALKKVINGKSMLSFSVAQNEQFRNLQGVVQERTTWINCSVWGRDSLAPYLRKGTLVYLEGRPDFKGFVGKQGEALAGVNLRVGELALLPGARGVLGTSRAGVEEASLGEEVADSEEMEDEVGEELDGEDGEELKGEDDEEVKDDGRRSDLPF